MNRWENVQELLSAISEFHDTRPDAKLEQFLEEVSLVSDIDTWEGTQNAVTLMTLHSSKGLEFPVVVIAGLEEGLLPFYSNTIDRMDLEEERRLFYVGVTRAQRKLYLTHTRMRYRFGEPSYPSSSRFLTEMGSENVEMVESRGSKRAFEPSNGDSFDQRPRQTRREAKSRTGDDGFFGDPIPDYESESQEMLEVKRGSLVLHETFGRGKVIDVKGSGDAKKAVVAFDEYGVKNLILKFARLKPA
jgi:DNA helicase-2/ATP-dependent DNA helicase PcrA